MSEIIKSTRANIVRGNGESRTIFFDIENANALTRVNDNGTFTVIGYVAGLDSVVQVDTVDDTSCAQGATQDRSIPLPSATGKWTLLITGQIAGTGATNADFYIRKNGAPVAEFQYLNAAASSGSFSISVDTSIEDLENDVFEFRNDNAPGDVGATSTKSGLVRWFKRP